MTSTFDLSPPSNNNYSHNTLNNQHQPSQPSLPLYETVLSHMKSLITQYLSLNLYTNALFYAEKSLNFSLNHNLTDVSDNIYDLAYCLYLNKEYSRCVNLIQKYNMPYYNLKFLILLGEALFSCEDYEGVITFLEKESISFESPITNDKHTNNFLTSIRYLLLAKAYEMQENKQSAIKNYILSLQYDASNIEAFDTLINHHLLSLEQRNDLLTGIQFQPENMWLNDYYLSKINDNIYMTSKSEVEYNDEKNNVLDILYKNNDQDLLQMEAEKCFIARDFNNAYLLLKKLNEDDFYNLKIIPMLCSCLIELDKVGDLYPLAYKLANNCSEKFISWYAVGCYYYSIKKYDMSRKYFLKCNQLNKNFPESWIALGNCYAGQDESDQALSSYRTCLRLFPGCHCSNLYIGMEFIRTNNFKTAFAMFQNALLLSNNDPLVYNEIGVVYYKQRKYVEAETSFKKGIELCNEDKSKTAQTLMINLGNCYRKMNKLNEAFEIYERLYYIDSKNVDVLNCLGYTLSLVGNYSAALEYFHKANFIKSNDIFAIEMINKCINDMNE